MQADYTFTIADHWKSTPANTESDSTQHLGLGLGLQDAPAVEGIAGILFTKYSTDLMLEP